MNAERLCARFQNESGDTASRWSIASEEDLAAQYVNFHENFSFAVVVLGWVEEGDLRMLGDKALIEQITAVGAESLDWRPTPSLNAPKGRLQC